MQDVFKAFAKFGNTKNDGTQISLSNSDKWMKQAGVIDGKKITTTDTAICFNKFKSKTLSYDQYVSYVEALAKEKNMNPEDIKSKMVKCAVPGTAGTTQAAKADVVNRMTDTSKYTGAHKQRFDESGQGRGREGRDDLHDNTGYVQGYKEKDTYGGKKK